MENAIILAGGLGTRLRPVTYEIPKPLIPIQGRTLTEWVIDVISPAGINQFFLSIGYQHQKIEKFFYLKKIRNTKIDYIIEKEPLGTGGWLKLIKPFKDDFVVVNGDNLFDIDFERFHELHKKSGAVVSIALTEVEDVTSSGVVEIDDYIIKRFVEKPSREEAPSNLINSGYYIFSPEVFDYLPKSDKFMLEKDVFPKLAKAGKLAGFYFDNQWFDTGTFERWESVIFNWRKR